MKKKTLLIIEDEPSLMKVLADKLIREHFSVLKSLNGKDGLALAFKRHPDLILLDLIMPVMNGTEVLKKLREDAWGRDVPVIILSNLNDKDQITKTMEHQVIDYMIKADWKLGDLVKVVKKRLDAK